MTGKLPPIPFIVGVPRSGTTLLRLMLDSHPDLTIPPETHFMRGLFRIEDRGRLTPERFVNFITGHRRWPDFGLDKNMLKKAIENLARFSMRDGLIIFYELYADRAGKSRWGDKTPKYVLLMDRIASIFPEARFIHIIRDGRDTVLSRKNSWLVEDKTVEVLIKEWKDIIHIARKKSESIEHYIEIRYEDLVFAPETVLKQVADFTDLPYTDEMLEYYKHAEERLREFKAIFKKTHDTLIRCEDRLKIHKNTLKPPDRSNIFRWKREMTVEDRELCNKLAGDLLRELGYEVD